MELNKVVLARVGEFRRALAELVPGLLLSNIIDLIPKRWTFITIVTHESSYHPSYISAGGDS